MVFYRKYRPQTIEELDSRQVRETLSAVLSGKNTPHAFLFTGPKGLGKTSAARIVAKIVNCERLVSQRLASSSKEKKLNAIPYALSARVEPCNKCLSCVSITNGTNLDVLEIDGASSRGIDEIRDLREKIGLAPIVAEKKVYIIDEVHMLTTEAFNALLKTLEEPPAHAMFILCTTEPHKVPPTIISRCSHVSFKLATQGELVRSFERIVHGEKIDAEKGTLDSIAQRSEGGFRDGAKLLEELVSRAKGGKITKELIEQVSHIGSINQNVTLLLDALVKRDAKKGIEVIASLQNEGVDNGYFLEQLLEALHELLLIEVGVLDKKKSINLSLSDIQKLSMLFSRAHSELKSSVLPQLPLELAVVEWSTHWDSSSVRPELAEVGTKISSVNAKDDLLYQLIDRIKVHNQSIAGVLRGSIIKSYNDDALTIETKYKFHKERLDDQGAQKLIEESAEELLGKNVKVSIVLK